MEINDFRKAYKVNLTDDELTKIVNYFLGGKVYGVNANFGLRGMYQYRNDGTKVNVEDYIALKDELLFDRLIAKKVNIFEITDKDERRKTLDGYSEEISNEISNSNDLVLSTDGLVSDDTENLDHEFFINVSAENYVSVLKAVYDVIKKRELTDVRIVTPTASKVNVGLVDSIKILCSSKDLEYTVKALESVEDIYKKKCDEVPNLYPSIKGWYGYSQINKETKRTAVEDISRFVLLSINESVKEFADANKDTVTVDGVSILDYLNNTKNRFVALQKIVSDNKDVLLPVIITKVKAKVSENGLDLANIFGIKTIEDELNNLYGNISFSQEFEQREEALNEIKANETVVVAAPVKFTVPDEIKQMEEQTEQSKDVVRDENYLDGLLNQVAETEENVEEKEENLVVPVIEAPVVPVAPVQEVLTPELNFEPIEKDANEDEESIKVNTASVENMLGEMNQVNENEEQTEVVVSSDTTSSVLGDNHELGEEEAPVVSEEVPIAVTPDIAPVVEAPVSAIAQEPKKVGVYGRDLNIVIPDFLKKYSRDSEQVKGELSQVAPVVTPDVTPEVPVSETAVVENTVMEQPVVEAPVVPVVEVPVAEVTPEVTPVENTAVPVVENIVQPVVETPVVSNEEARLDAMLSNVEAPNVQEVTPVVEQPIAQSVVEQAVVPAPAVPSETLTQEEVNSVVNDGVNLSNTDAVVKYSSVMENLGELNLEVKGQNMTVLQFFELNNLLGVLQPTDYVQLHPEIGGTITAKEFVSNYLVHYLTQSGEGDLNYIIGLYSTGIVKNLPEEKEKKGLFKGLFKSKK